MATPMRLMLVGATGVVGRAVLAQALADPRVGELIVLTRRPLPFAGAKSAPRLTNLVVDFDNLPEKASWWAVDAVLCTLGTTMSVAGSQQNFAAIDRDLPVHIARLARSFGATRFSLNSSMGADPNSGTFYMRTKGEVEAAIRALGYPGLTIVRPALIDAQRTDSRPGERLGILFARAFRPLIPARWRAVTPTAIARALLDGALAPTPTIEIIESDRLQISAG